MMYHENFGEALQKANARIDLSASMLSIYGYLNQMFMLSCRPAERQELSAFFARNRLSDFDSIEGACTCAHKEKQRARAEICQKWARIHMHTYMYVETTSFFAKEGNLF